MFAVQSKPNTTRYTAEVMAAKRELREAQEMLTEARESLHWAQVMGDEWGGYWQDLECCQDLVREKRNALMAMGVA